MLLLALPTVYYNLIVALLTWSLIQLVAGNLGDVFVMSGLYALFYACRRHKVLECSLQLKAI